MTGSLAHWIEQHRLASDATTTPISLEDCDGWKLEGGEIRHETGRFFQVVGITVDDGPFAGWRQPMLRQTEVGILGFLVRRGERGWEWLVQAKSEPGNVDGVQLAPTVQATRSNFERAHGGRPTRHLEWFRGRDRPVAAEWGALASEHGTRFLDKCNQNATVVLPEGIDVDVAPGWRWTTSDEMRGALGAPFAINTDARSVLVSTPWSYLADGSPFERWSGTGELGDALFRSHRASGAIDPVLRHLVAARRGGARQLVEVPLDDLPGWTLGDVPSLRSEASPIGISCMAVTDSTREVTAWAQPLMSVDEETVTELCCQVRDGALRFLFRRVWEPGLVNEVELGPTYQSDGAPGWLDPAPGLERRVHLEICQSDEGGRFLESVCRYRVVELEPGPTVDGPDDVWLDLGQVEALSMRSATFTNEARSAISTLLTLV